MHEGVDKYIEEDLYKMTDYDKKLKDKVWANIQQELEQERKAYVGLIGRKRGVSKGILIAALCGVFMVTTVLAKPVLEELITYFGEAKIQRIYNHRDESWVNTQAALYESELGYMTYYNDEYFEVIQKGERDHFLAKDDPETYIEIWLEAGKEFEEVLEKETGQKLEDLNPMLFDERAVEVSYKEDVSDSKRMTVTLLSEAQELGTFVIRMTYDSEKDVSGRMCHDLANEFIPLYAKNREKISQAKPQLFFEYNTNQYELVQYTSNQSSIYLQKKGVHQPNYESDILLIYSYYFDQSVDEKLEEILDRQEQRRQSIMNMFGGREEEATGLTFMKEELSEMSIPSRKLIEIEEDTQALWRTIYLVDDGMGGCYELYIYLPEQEALKRIIDSIEIRQELPKNMEYRIVEDNTLG